MDGLTTGGTKGDFGTLAYQPGRLEITTIKESPVRMMVLASMGRYRRQSITDQSEGDNCNDVH
jgi:hypothetical protein